MTGQEWCEKQVEFTKLLGKPKQTEAMKAGSARHAELEIEVRIFYGYSPVCLQYINIIQTMMQVLAAY